MILAVLAFPVRARADGGAQVSFTFDDGFASNLSYAAPILAAHRYPATAYITTSYVGRSNYMSWDGVASLRRNYGWEIGSHSVNHLMMSQINDAQKIRELADSRAALRAHGLNPTSFATPYGDYDTTVLADAAKYYTSHRAFRESGNNVWPYSDYLLSVKQLQEGVSIDQVKADIDEAAANGYWLIFVLHNVVPNPTSVRTDFQYGTEELKQVAAYIQSKDIHVATVSDGLAHGQNLLPSSQFTGGLSDSWFTDDSAHVQSDRHNHGNAPSGTYSLNLRGSQQASHLFSPVVDVRADQAYAVKSFLNVTYNNAGEVALYVDEYNADGVWISGQYKTAERTSFVENLNASYRPSSAAVAKARVQVIVAAGSDLQAYIDNVQLIAER